MTLIMKLRSGRKKPVCGRQPYRRKALVRNASSPAAAASGFKLQQKVECYILTEDSKTVHFDLDEDGRHEISTKDSQSLEDMAWLYVFTSNEQEVSAETYSRNLVALLQRSKCNEFVLLSKGKRQHCLKVLKVRSEPDHSSVKSSNKKKCMLENVDFKKLSEDNHFFIMHCEGDSVKFQCYEDRNYFLHVNDDSLDIRKLDYEDPEEEKNFYFKVSYL